MGIRSTRLFSKTCIRSGLPLDAWLDEDIEVQHIQAQIFAEWYRGGSIREELMEGLRVCVALDDCTNLRCFSSLG